MFNAINSPFRYPGGKFYARKLILEHIPPHSHYIEPFTGGASIFFAKEKVSNNWLNDIDEQLINCLLIIRDHPEDLINKLQGENIAEVRELYSWATAIYDKEWNYTVGRTDDQKKVKNPQIESSKTKGSRYKGQEIFITNYEEKTSILENVSEFNLVLICKIT